MASGASTELLLEQSTWVARARGRATFEGSFRRHEAGCRFVHFCEHTFAPLFQSFRLRRLALFAFVLPMPPKSRAEAAASRAARAAARSNRSPAAAPSPAARGDTPGGARTPLSRLAPQASGTVATPGSIASVVSPDGGRRGVDESRRVFVPSRWLSTAESPDRRTTVDVAPEGLWRPQLNTSMPLLLSGHSIGGSRYIAQYMVRPVTRAPEVSTAFSLHVSAYARHLMQRLFLIAHA